MREISEIKADLEAVKIKRRERPLSNDSWYLAQKESLLESELLYTIIAGVTLRRLEAICAAEREGRCVVLREELERVTAEQWVEAASDNTEYVLAYADGIYSVSDSNGDVVCEFMRGPGKEAGNE